MAKTITPEQTKFEFKTEKKGKWRKIIHGEKELRKLQDYCESNQGIRILIRTLTTDATGKKQVANEIHAVLDSTAGTRIFIAPLGSDFEAQRSYYLRQVYYFEDLT